MGNEIDRAAAPSAPGTQEKEADTAAIVLFTPRPRTGGKAVLRPTTNNAGRDDDLGPAAA